MGNVYPATDGVGKPVNLESFVDAVVLKLVAENEELKRQLGTVTCERDCIKHTLESIGILTNQALGVEEDLCNLSEACPVQTAVGDEDGTD